MMLASRSSRLLGQIVDGFIGVVPMFKAAGTLVVVD